MQVRLTLKHLSGSRANEKDNLALPPEREIILGRDPDCHVRYHEADDLVSRKHLKIVATDEQPVRYMVVDLGSRNGTFVNRQRVFGAVLLLPGGHVQLGAGGPEFEFGLSAGQIHKSRKKSRGLAVKRRLARSAIFILMLAAACAAGYAGWIRLTPLWRNWRTAQTARESRAITKSAAALNPVDAEWSLLDKRTGARLYRAYIANERISHMSPVPLLEGAPAVLPAFVMGPDRQIEPLLIPFDSAHAGRAVGGRWSLKSLIASDPGAALAAITNQPPWNTAWRWSSEETAGALLVTESSEAAALDLKIKHIVPLAASQFPRWVPAESDFLVEELPAELPGVLHGRHLSYNDLNIDVTATFVESGRILKAKLTPESSRPVGGATDGHAWLP